MARKRKISRSLRNKLKSSLNQDSSLTVRKVKRNIKGTLDKDEMPSLSWNYDVGDLVRFKGDNRVHLIIGVKQDHFRAGIKMDHKGYILLPTKGRAVRGREIDFI